MKKQRRTSGFSWSKQQTIIFIVSVAIVVAWGYFYNFIVDHYGHQMAIALTALLVASIAAIGTLLSLKWTRDTIRPFLSLCESIPVNRTKDMVTITFNIKNSGSLPASDVHSDIDFFDEGEEVTEDNLSSKYPPPHRPSEYSLLFPNNTYYEKFRLDLKDKSDLELWENIKEGKVKVRTRIMYSGLKRKHITIDTAQIVRMLGEEQLQMLPIPPQKWT